MQMFELDFLNWFSKGLSKFPRTILEGTPSSDQLKLLREQTAELLSGEARECIEKLFVYFLALIFDKVIFKNEGTEPLFIDKNNN